MNNIYSINNLDSKEKNIYDNLLKILELKSIKINKDIIINYIKNHSLKNVYITIDILNTIIKECTDIQNIFIEKKEKENKLKQKEIELKQKEEELKKQAENLKKKEDDLQQQEEKIKKKEKEELEKEQLKKEEEENESMNNIRCNIVKIESDLFNLDDSKKDFIDIENNSVENLNSINDIPDYVDFNKSSKESDLDDNKTKVLTSIVKNTISSVPKYELREDYIHIKGVSGDKYKYTDTYLLKKKYNNVKSIELIGGYINDSPFSPSSSISGDGPQESDDSILVGIETDKDEIMGSIGPIPYVWIDIEEPKLNTYTHYSNLTVKGSTGSCDCSGLSYCSKCDITEETFTDTSPHGTFLVKLEQYNFLDHYYKGGAINTSSVSGVGAKNIVYLIDQPCSYVKSFSNLISMSKFKINIRNIVGKPLWGCDNDMAENDIWKKNKSSEGAENMLLRWEFTFKVSYYVNVLDNKFLLQSS